MTLPALRSDHIRRFAGAIGQGWAARLRAALADAGEADTLLLVADGIAIDDFTLGQLQEALASTPGIDVVSPTATHDVIEAWSLDERDDAVLEAWTWSPHAALAAPPDPRCALWARAAAERVAAGDEHAGARSVRLPHVAVALGDSATRQPLAWIDARWRPSRLAIQRPAPTPAGRDGRPVVLHVLHDWGGGVGRFVADQMRDAPEATHLALVSSGDERRGHGRQVALHVDLERGPIRLWPCHPTLGDMADQHPAWRAALAETIGSFGVSSLRVSSLIGASLDVFETGLPTAFVIHDAFPFWPWLDDADAAPGWNPERLADAAATAGWLFGETRPAAWLKRSTATIDAIRRNGVRLVAPSRAALSRLQRLVPDDLLPDARVIPHGIAPMPVDRPSTRRAGPLRVLVPGRLRGHKGERLLEALLPIAPRDIEWTFAGGGELATRFATRTGGRAIPEYAVADLPGLVLDVEPDLALLPSLLPETFGYVLSEMQALGVPVLAAAHGAYAERIDAASNGLRAVAPDAAAFAAALVDLAASPSRLPRRLPPPPSLDAARRAWQDALPAVSRRPRAVACESADLAAHARGILSAEAEFLRRERDDAYLAHARDTADLAAQRDAAMRHAEALASKHAREAADLAAQREAAMRRADELATDVERERTERATLADALEAAAAERDLAYGYYERDTADLIRQRDTALSQRDAAQEQLAAALRTLANPLIRWPLRLWRRGGDALAAWRYRLQRSVDLGRRGLRSLRQRGVGATWAAIARRFQAATVASVPLEAEDGPIAFSVPAEVRASVVIPVYGKLAYTLACLRSLARTRLPPDTELIVVDDASPDDSGKVLPKIPGLRYHRNAQNLGFVGSCNAGAALARGEFLVFLNNDTTLTPGWLEALLRTFQSHPDTGLAGAQLVYPDGRLQESGGIVFSDGSGWNYGRFDDPRHPAYTFVREVDYCSGAAVALRRELFDRLGGFEACYAPAYYEDTDLAMKVREAGLKVRVQPASVVVHHEGITAGTDTGSGVKAYQVRNQKRFVERWRDTLARRHPAPSQAAHYAAQHRARARVLVIDATTPMPDRDSGSVRLFELLRLFVNEGCAVTFFPENGLDDGRYTQALRELGVEAWTQPWLGALPDWLAKHGPRFQLIVVSRHYVLSPLLALLRRHAPQARIVFDTVDLHHLREAREAEERGDDALRRTAARTREDELALIAAVDRTWVVSPVEKALLAEAIPGATIDVVSNIHRVRGRGPAMSARRGLLFVGGFRHPPNVDAALWLADDILPRIRAARPDVTLSLVGGDAPPAVLALGEREGITVHGHVPDLEPLIDAHRLSIAPLRYGAGVKGKVNQALAHGLPVVATSCAVEGMGLTPGIDVLVANDAEGIASVVLAAYDDEPLWQRLVDGGLANTEREFSPERARGALRAIFHDLR